MMNDVVARLNGFSICCGSLNRREFRTHISLYLSPHMGSWFKDYFGFEEPRPNLIKSMVGGDNVEMIATK